MVLEDGCYAMQSIVVKTSDDKIVHEFRADDRLHRSPTERFRGATEKRDSL